MSTEIVTELKASYEKFGPLRKVVKTRYGIAAGETRKRAVAEWPEAFKHVKDFYEHLQIKAADNISGLKPAAWWEGVIAEACRELAKKGVEKGKIVERLEKDFPLSKQSLYRYIPGEFKEPSKVKAGQASAAARRSAPVSGTEKTVPEALRKPLEKLGSMQQRPSLTGSPTYPISQDASKFARKVHTPEHMRLFNAFMRKGFNVKDEWPIPMDKWKCPKCRQTWIEEPPLKCNKCGLEPVRLDYHIDILLDDRWAVEPGGKQHDFISDKERDASLQEHNILPYHYTNELVNTPDGPYLIVQYHILLKKLEQPEEHTLVVDGHVKHVYLDGEDIQKTGNMVKTKGPAVIKVVSR